MTKQQVMSLGVDEVVAAKIVQMSKDEFKGFVPRERFNEVNEAKKEAQERLKELAVVATENKRLLEQLETMRGESKNLENWYEEQLAKSRLDKAIYLALSKARAKNIKAVYALLDTNYLNLDDEGNVLGLDEQLVVLTKAYDSRFLFAKQVGM